MRLYYAGDEDPAMDGPANALTASAAVFEAVSDVDARFSKLTDKECDGISAEVKKWFKKLAVRHPLAPRSSPLSHYRR